MLPRVCFKCWEHFLRYAFLFLFSCRRYCDMTHDFLLSYNLFIVLLVEVKTHIIEDENTLQYLGKNWYFTHSGQKERTLGRCHLIAFLGSGSSGIPMDCCSAGKVGSENSTPDFRHSSIRVWKSWSLNLIGFSLEPKGATLSFAMLPEKDQQNSSSEVQNVASGLGLK